jgi:glycosyltransferase involved in cell wall biosynthesis
MVCATKRCGVLIIVENLPVPFDRRVWQEARTLRDAGYRVSIVCPIGKDYPKRYECIDGIHIYRHPMLNEADSPLGYLIEYAVSLFWELALATYILFRRGFAVIQACNPPDLIFIVALPFKLLGKRFIFDHHDINPELYEAKFGRRDIFYRFIVLCERLSFAAARVSIATNESYKQIAIERGRMDPCQVFVVRSGPDLSRLRRLPPDESLKRGRKYLVGYLGVIGKQEGVDYLLRAARHIVVEKGRKDVLFAIVGDGTELESLKAYAYDIGVAGQVVFTGRIPDDEMLRVLNTADVCVNPDVANPMNDKSTMNKVMEYMALAKPVVQFDLTEGHESAKAASLYAKPNDETDLSEKILELLDDPERREQMGKLGRYRVESELEWQHQAPILLQAYEAALR